MNESYVNVTAYDQTQWAKGFISDYQSEFGHVPYINPAPRVKIQYGTTLLPEDRVEGLKRNAVYNKWYYSQFIDSDPETCSNAILFYPQPFTPRIPDHRDTHRSFRTVGGLGYFTQLISVYTGSPDIVITSRFSIFHLVHHLSLTYMNLEVAQVAYNSTISYQTEQLPI
jgi:hypothetical protein